MVYHVVQDRTKSNKIEQNGTNGQRNYGETTNGVTTVENGKRVTNHETVACI